MSPRLLRFPTVHEMVSTSLDDVDWVETAGYAHPGDGGAGLYQLLDAAESPPNGIDRLIVADGRVATLVENQAVNYLMFGAPGDGDADDGIFIKRSHEYANECGIPVVNRSGEFWIKETNDIRIRTNVNWGQTTFHIDEKCNSKTSPRFVVENDRPMLDLSDDGALKAALLSQVKPGVQIIPELAGYAGHLISVEDTNDRIGIRAGNYSKAGWAREELFYVEEEGKIIGDIAWPFKDLTKIEAKPCSDCYLIVEGGGFYFSGEHPQSGEEGYHHHGIAIERSRTIVREQWMGLERGMSDDTMEPRRGFYVFNGVYDVTLENIRAMPWEKNRTPEERVLKAGTYGIGGARMLNCKFKNLTAEGGWVAWGVFGTNLNKNFRVEDCRLNRIDVHFHCWNLYISNCTVGFKGISVTGGGDLFIDNTVRHGPTFVNFRPDYGSKWDGHVRIRGCTFKPSGDQATSVLSYRPNNFDYQYSIGYARSILIEDMIIDYTSAPESVAPCWLVQTVSFSKTDDGTRLFFPERMTFRNISVEGRDQGVRLIGIHEPGDYSLTRKGGYDGSRVVRNCDILGDRVDLERMSGKDDVHLQLGSEDPTDYADAASLYPRVRFVDCEGVRVAFRNCVASLFVERCTVSQLSAIALRGDLNFDACGFQPETDDVTEALNVFDSSLETRFTNCTIHAPIVSGKASPEYVDRSGMVEINKRVSHSHLNTSLGNDILAYLKSEGIALSDAFAAKLRHHHCPGA